MSPPAALISQLDEEISQMVEPSFEEEEEEEGEEDSSADEPGLEIADPAVAAAAVEGQPEGPEPPVAEPSPSPDRDLQAEEDMLMDIPPEAMTATTRGDFFTHMRPYVWLKFPSATAQEINAFITARWGLLKASRKVAASK